MTPHTRLRTLVFALAATATSAHAVPAYHQPSTFPNVCQGCWTSSTTTGANGFQTFENFTLGTGGGITKVGWEGSYWDFINPANNPVAANTNNWQLTIWSDAGGSPGAQLFSETQSAAMVSSVFKGNGTFFNGDPVSTFDFLFTLSTPFAASAGTTYWVSALSFSASNNPLFSWSSGTGGDGTTWQVQLGNGNTFVRNSDRALSVFVPEPGTLALLGFGVLAGGIGARHTRR